MALTPQDYRKVLQTHRRGTAANRPGAATVLEGTLYFSTDTGVIERSNGVAWESYGGGGGVGSIGPTGAAGIDGEFYSDEPLVIPGSRGADGAAGSTGSAGATGPAVFFLVDEIEPDPPIPGIKGADGASGTIGRNGITVPGIDGEPGDDAYPIPGLKGDTGSTGNTGSSGPIGPAIYLAQDEIESEPSMVPGPIGLTGAQGPAGGGGTATDDFSFLMGVTLG